ncbi:ABC transporter substrate-binding protein [Haloarchaeobius sp. HME9146]|nr:ABC transporter substrate-binding protein [Haloarchaeobius sp. HME9146]MCT9096755.1 ABC transporter substrate-binding protein [Haloarchaeobius sp. HME9146]
MQSDRNRRLSRRKILAGTGVSIATLSAGCFESSGGDTDGGSGGGGGGGGGGGDSDDSDGGSGGDGGMSTYTIGMVDSLTGSLAPYGKRNKRGKELALSKINDAGVGPNGEGTLEITVEDDESTNQAGLNAASKLVNQDGVPLLLGSVGSGVSIAIYDSVVQGTDVVQISQNSTSPELTTRAGLNRMSPSGAAKGKALAQFVADEGHDSVAVTWINNDYGQGLQGVFSEAFPGEVAYNKPHDQGQSSYSSLLTEMAGTDASAWLFLTYANEFTVMANNAFDQGYNEQVDYFGAESTVAEEILGNTPEGSLDGMKGITESAPADQENYKNFVSEFESEYDTTPTVWSAYAYDAVTVAAIAVTAADEFTGPAIEEVVRDVTRPEGQEAFTYEEAAAILQDGGSPSDVNYQGVSGPVDLDENGDPPGFYQVYSVADHEYDYGDYITS